MSISIRLFAFVVATAMAGCARPQAAANVPADLAPAQSDSGFTVRRLADGVYAVTRNEPLGLINESNSLFIVGDRDVIIVDAQSSSARTRETLAALRRLTDKPVSMLVNTHWHDDHVVGNEVYKAAFPNLQIVGHITSTEDMETTGAKFRKGGVANRAGTASFLRGLATKKESFLGGPADPEESRSHALSAWLTEDYSNPSIADFMPLTPTTTVADSLIVMQGKRRIEIRFLGKGHTRGDLVVFLPAERILATGDLLMWPVQFIGSTSYPEEFSVTEERLRALKPKLVVPGHGRVLTEAEADAHAALIARALRALSEQANAAVAKGESLADAKKHLELSTIRQEMAGNSTLRKTLFSYYVADAGFARAYELATVTSVAEKRAIRRHERRLGA